MIVYDPLWNTLKKKGLSTYTLRVILIFNKNL